MNFCFMQRIPKHVVNNMPIEQSGRAYLVNGENEVIDAEFCPTADGRLRFTKGWAEFVKANDLKSGQTGLVIFDRIGSKLFISFDIVD